MLSVEDNELLTSVGRGTPMVLEPGEDWRLLGTDEDPAVQEALAH